jgi:hypothetical protein
MADTKAVDVGRALEEAPAEDFGGEADGHTPAADPTADTAKAVGRMLIREAYLNAEVASFDAAVRALHAMAEREKGFVVSSTRSIDSYAEVHSGTVVIRVPSERFDAVMEGLNGILSKIESVNVSTQDVTEEYVDLEARIRNKRRLEERYLDLLTRAGEMKELLEVERALAEVRGELERLEGRERFLRNKVSLSTLTIEMHEPYPAVGSDDGGPLKILARSFANGADFFVYVLAGMITVAIAVAPLFVLFGAVGGIVFLFVRRRRLAAGRKHPSAPAGPDNG